MRRFSTLLSSLGRAWFPVALGVLILLALPGAVLLAIHLFGLEPSVNNWLQTNLGISYHLAVPWWAGLLLLLIPFLLVLLYFLKLKRKPLHVPSTFLWQKSIEDLHVNTLFQWLRENVLLLLQLLTLLALIYAVLAFQLHRQSSQGEHYILMIDNSASMAATDVAPSRLEGAKRLALQEIAGRGDNDVGMVIVFNSSAEILQSYTPDKGLLRQAVEKIQQTQRPTRIDEALSLADSLANPRRTTDDFAVRPEDQEPGKERTYVPAEGIPTVLHLFTDGRFPDVKEFALGNLQARYHAIGLPGPENADNIALVTLNALRNEKDPTKLQVLAGVHNYRPQEAQVKLQLEVYVNGQLQKLYEEPQGDPMTLPARRVRLAELAPKGDTTDQPRQVLADEPGEGFVTFTVSDLDERSNLVLHAKLVGVQDHFPLDDEAWLTAGVVRKARVLIVGDRNPVLHAFFEGGAGKIATVTYLAPADLGDEDKYGRPARNGAYDLVIFDRCAPEKESDLPLANTYFIDNVPPPWKRAEMPPLENPSIKGRLGDHPLLRYLSGLHEIGLTEAFRFDLRDPRVPPRVPKLLESGRDTAVLFALPRQSFTDVVMTFPIINSKGEYTTDWFLRPSFPLFLSNLVHTLGNVSEGVGEEVLQPGQPKSLRPDLAVKEIQVEDPAGHVETLRRGSRADFTYGATDRVGVYQVKWDGQVQRSFAVNLLDPLESNLEPREVIAIGDARVAAGETRSVPREVWKWVALAALVLLLAEWYVYNRRVYV